MKIDLKRPHPMPGYQIEKLDGEILLFHPASQKVIYSNSSGALIWQLCNGEHTVADIISLLSAAYPEAADQIAVQVRETLLTFAENGAIIWA